MTDNKAPGQTGNGGSATGKLATVFLSAFTLAFLLAWLLFRPAPVPLPAEPAPAAVLAGPDLDEFFRAVARGDYDGMSRLGNGLFEKGVTVRDADRVFAGFEVNGYPPYRVFAFFADHAGDRLYRVMLTLDENDKVESFMAEDTRIIQHEPKPVGAAGGAAESGG